MLPPLNFEPVAPDLLVVVRFVPEPPPNGNPVALLLFAEGTPGHPPLAV